MNKINVKQELDRRRSITARMLEAFKQKRVLTTKELNHFGNGCSSRLHELRKEGHDILAVYERPGHYRYVYRGQKTELPDDWDVIKAQATLDDHSRLSVIE